VYLSALAQGSLPAVELVPAVPIEAIPAATLSVEAFVHRHFTARAGAIVLLALDRVVARRPAALEGLTIVGRVSLGSSIDAASLGERPDLVERLLERCAAAATERLPDLLRHALAAGRAWETPLCAQQLEQVSGPGLRLRYVAEAGTLALAWDEHPLLTVVVAHDREGRPRTAADALDRLRRAGGIVVEQPGRRWQTLESRDPLYAPWAFDDVGRRLIARLAGEGTFWDMPVVPEAYPRPLPARDQLHLLRSEADVRRDLERGSDDRFARERLVGHLLVARLSANPELGLADVPLFVRYDPRALAPSRVVSLRAVDDEVPPLHLTPSGTVGRTLRGPVLECSPGVAALLHELEALEGDLADRDLGAAAVAVEAGRVPRRRRGARPDVLVSRTVADELAVGQLRLESVRAPRIALWARGLCVGEIVLGGPAGVVSGRVVLTTAGTRVSEAALRRALERHAVALVDHARRLRPMLGPESSRRRALEAVLAEGEASSSTPSGPDLDASLRAHPPRMPQGGEHQRLANVVMQALQRRLRVDTSFLTRRPARLGGMRGDGAWEVDLGTRDPFVARALRVPARTPAAAADVTFVAAALVVADLFAQAREQQLAPVQGLPLALWRVLAVRVAS
jgi:hypothetical protein